MIVDRTPLLREIFVFTVTDQTQETRYVSVKIKTAGQTYCHA